MQSGLLVIGIVVLLLAVGAQTYYITETTSGFFGSSTTASFPYRYLAFPMGLAGLVLIAVGLATNDSTTIVETKESSPVSVMRSEKKVEITNR